MFKAGEVLKLGIVNLNCGICPRWHKFRTKEKKNGGKTLNRLLIASMFIGVLNLTLMLKYFFQLSHGGPPGICNWGIQRMYKREGNYPKELLFTKLFTKTLSFLLNFTIGPNPTSFQTSPQLHPCLTISRLAHGPAYQILIEPIDTTTCRIFVPIFVPRTTSRATYPRSTRSIVWNTVHYLEYRGCRISLWQTVQIGEEINYLNDIWYNIQDLGSYLFCEC